MRREAFHLPDGRYFLSHSIGLQPKQAAAALEEGYAAPWRRGGADIWNDWLAAIDSYRSALAPLIGAKPEDICPQTNVSSALTKILFSLPERARRRKIVLTEDDFPTVGFVLAQARRAGYELVFLPGGERLIDIDAWSPAFHDDVQLVLATHVFSNSGVRAPIADIAARARARGVFSVIDIAQSAGAVTVELGGWGADFAIGSAVKYLCGGPGACFLWAEQETAARCAPTDVGWFSHEAPFEFNIHDFRYAGGAMRFWGGTPSVAPYAAAAAGFEILAEAGIHAIFAHNQRLLSRLIDALPPNAILSCAREGARGSAVIIGVKDAEAAAASLSAQKLMHDLRMGGIRVSVHLYTTQDDVDALAAALQTHV
ncbi:MAG: aminotransferase class V-fold PLP-dependent enzyme [Amphiplicatus sp.]